MTKSTGGDRRTDGGSKAASDGAKAMTDAGSAVAAGLQDIAQAWADYAQQVMQRTTEATDALLKCRNLSDILDVQADLMRGHLQAFLDQSSKLAEISTRMAERSLVTVRHPEGTRSN